MEASRAVRLFDSGTCKGKGKGKGEIQGSFSTLQDDGEERTTADAMTAKSKQQQMRSTTLLQVFRDTLKMKCDRWAGFGVQ